MRRCPDPRPLCPTGAALAGARAGAVLGTALAIKMIAYVGVAPVVNAVVARLPVKPVLIGADGAGSALRAAMNADSPLGERTEWLGHGYKELEIPPAPRLPPALLRAVPVNGFADAALTRVRAGL